MNLTRHLRESDAARRVDAAAPRAFGAVEVPVVFLVLSVTVLFALYTFEGYNARGAARLHGVRAA